MSVENKVTRFRFFGAILLSTQLIQTNPYRLVRNKANIGFSIPQVILFLWEFEQFNKRECLTEISY